MCLFVTHRQIDWLKYIGDVYSLADVSVSNDERLIVEETEYLKKLIALLESTEPRTIGTTELYLIHNQCLLISIISTAANYILWRLVDKLMIETSKQMVDLSFEFTKVIFGTSQPEPRSVLIYTSHVNYKRCSYLCGNYLNIHCK